MALKPGQISRPDPTRPRAGQGYPHVPGIADPNTQQSVQLLWERVQEMQARLTLAEAAGTAKDSQIADLQTQLYQTSATAQSALAAAGKFTSNLPQMPGEGNTSPPPGEGVGGGGTTLPPEPPNYLAYVQQAKDDLVAALVPLAGPCGAFEITKLATYRLKDVDPQVGLLLKPSGNNCGGYATAIINFLGGRIVDILADDGGANTPQWAVLNESRPADQWAAPIPGAIP